MGTFVYSPGIRVIIDTATSGTLDISDDLSSAQLTLRENAIHSFSCGLINKRHKYDSIFTPNDRIVVYLKRVRWLLCFSGYLNTVPYFTAYERTVTLDASCTLKRLQYHFWDPGTTHSFELLFGPNNSGTGADFQQTTDGGMSQKIVNLLTKVCGWDQSKIHVGAIPAGWVNKVTALLKAVLPEIQASAIAPVGSGAIIGGASPALDGLQSKSAAPGTQLPAAFGVITDSDPSISQGSFDLTGESASSPGDQWYCAMRWPYLQAQPSWTNPSASYLSASDEQYAKSFWKNQRMLVTNPITHKAVVVRAVAWGPNSLSGEIIAASSQALSAIGASNGDQVQVSFAPDGSPLGVYSSSAAQGIVNAATDALGKLASLLTPASPDKGAAQAVSFAEAQIGKTYATGGTGPNQFDCSGLTSSAWASAGVHIPRTSQEQYLGSNIQLIDYTLAQPGDLVFYDNLQGGSQPGHVAMVSAAPTKNLDGSYTDGQIVQAENERFNILYSPILQPGFTFMGIGRVSAPTTGLPNAPTTPTPASVPRISGSSSAASDPGSTGTANSGATPALNTSQWYGGQPDPSSELLAGPRALMNDEPILPTIDTLVQASMRSYCSAPNGDFCAWFPDYFGAYGVAGIMQVRNIELRDFTLVWSDNNLVTHQFVAGAFFGQSGSNAAPGGPVGLHNMLMTEGIVSIEMPEVLDALFNLQGSETPWGTVKDILDRYGPRPNYQSVGTLKDPSSAEFWFALSLFQRNWAQQFTAQVPLTFMPELWPGMLLQLSDYGFQAYINQVVHSINLSDGGGFTTDVFVSAPSRTSSEGSSLWGLQVAGAGA